jgi:hypothetical protein
VAIETEKFRALQVWPEPISLTELRRFLGLAGYYIWFIRNYGKICKLLFDGLKKGEFKWGDLQKAAFEEIKTTLYFAPVLALPDFTKP